VEASSLLVTEIKVTRADAPRLLEYQGTSMARESRGTTNPDAYDLYLKGQYFWSMRGAPNLLKAPDYFQRAVKADPNFARAVSRMAMTYSVMPGYMPDPKDSITPRSIETARRALAMDSTMVSAHLAMAQGLATRNQSEAAESLYFAALKLEPDNATAHQWHATNLRALARLDE